MAKPSVELISALRETADRVESGARYEWGHMAHCNCGHLIQTVTQQTGIEVARKVNDHLLEWTEHAQVRCSHTGHPLEEMFEALEKVGFTREDVIHLENLSDRQVLCHLGERVHLNRNQRDDVVRYLRAMAELLERDLLRITASVLLGHAKA